MTQHTEILENIDYNNVREHYDDREAVSHTLRKFHRLQEKDAVRQYAEMAVGYSDNQGNHSASEHGKSRIIILDHANPAVNNRRIFDLGAALLECDPRDALQEVIDAHIKHIKASVGTEMGMMLRPNELYCTNARTVFGTRALESGVGSARELIEVYKDDQVLQQPEGVWYPFHEELSDRLVTLSDISREIAAGQDVTPGEEQYLWADSVCNELYNQYMTTSPTV